MSGRSIGGGLTPAVSWIIAISVGCFLVLAFVGEDTKAMLHGWLALDGASLARLQVWKLATTAVLVDTPLGFIFDVLMLWMFVPTFERFWGTRRFVVFFVTTLVVGNLVGALVGLLIAPLVPILGISPFIFAAIAAYGIVFANQDVRFFGVVPIKGKHLAIGMLVFVTIVVLLEQQWVFGASVYGAMGAAYALVTGKWQPRVWWLKARRERLKRKYKVIDGGASSDKPRYMN